MCAITAACAESACMQVFAINADTEGRMVRATTLDASAAWSGLVGSGGGAGGAGMVTAVSILDFSYVVLADGTYDAAYAGSGVPRYVRIESTQTPTTPVLAVGVFGTSAAAVVERGVVPVPAPATMPAVQAWAQYWLGVTIAGASIAACAASWVYKRTA